MNCPRCQESLREHTYASHVQVDECPRCLGMWLDDGELKRIEKAAEHDASGFQEGIDLVALRSPGSEQRDRPAIDCPKCGARMLQREAHYCPDVIIDICGSCRGVWLDGGEVQEIARVHAQVHADHQRQFTAWLVSGLRGLRGV